MEHEQVAELVSAPCLPLEFVHRGAARRVLLVGTGKRAARVARQLRGSSAQTLIGVMDSTAQPQVNQEFPELPFLGPLSELGEIILRKRVDEIVVALPMRSGFDDVVKVMRVAAPLGVPASIQVDLPRGNQKIVVGRREEALVFTQCGHRVSRWPWRGVKRGLDLVIASAALVILAPVFLAIALFMKANSTGPVFFRQMRLGQGGRIFTMFKFRTMVTDAEEQRQALRHANNAAGASFKIFDDPRIVRGGRFLRHFSLDELPQLFNVIRGEMSLVGPRPLPVWVAEEVESLAYHRRWSMPSGMTGLWQVRGRVQDFDRMGRLDVEYAERWSIWLDLKILLLTPYAVFAGRNAF